MSRRKHRSKSSTRFRRLTSRRKMPHALGAGREAAPPVIRVFSYGPDDFVEQEIDDLDRLADLRRHSVTWVDVQGLGDVAAIEKLGSMFGLHPLSVEDVVNTHQRAKVEDYGEYLCLVARTIVFESDVETEQVAFFLGRDFVVTFEEKPGDCFDRVRKGLRSAKGIIRKSGADYLAYSLLNSVVDSYFPVLEKYGEWLDTLDEEVAGRPNRDTTERLHKLKSELFLLRRAVWPLRDAIGELSREPNPLVSADTRLFLRDCHDHTIEIIDLVETSRELCSDLRDYYLSIVNNRMSETIKVLTVIATIFIPITFIVGLYGMNFDTGASPWNMPELRWQFGYFFALGLMGTTVLGMLYFFWRRGWLGP